MKFLFQHVALAALACGFLACSSDSKSGSKAPQDQNPQNENTTDSKADSTKTNETLESLQARYCQTLEGCADVMDGCNVAGLCGMHKTTKTKLNKAIRKYNPNMKGVAELAEGEELVTLCTNLATEPFKDLSASYLKLICTPWVRTCEEACESYVDDCSSSCPNLDLQEVCLAACSTSEQADEIYFGACDDMIDYFAIADRCDKPITCADACNNMATSCGKDCPGADVVGICMRACIPQYAKELMESSCGRQLVTVGLDDYCYGEPDCEIACDLAANCQNACASHDFKQVCLDRCDDDNVYDLYDKLYDARCDSVLELMDVTALCAE